MKKIFSMMTCLILLVFITACESETKNPKPDDSIAETETVITDKSMQNVNTEPDLRTVSQLPPKAETSMEQIDIQVGTEEKSSMEKIQLTVGDQNFAVTLYDNAAARSLEEILPVTLDMSELHGNEKYVYLQDDLPTDSAVPQAIHTGDLMLFGSDCLVLFYKGFSTNFSYTPLGYVENTDKLAQALGTGNVRISFHTLSYNIGDGE